MHILVINDDGPPDPAHSPYVFQLVTTLRDAGHVVSVCLPHVQRSWIGKAHFIGQRITPTYYRPSTDGTHGEGGSTTVRPSRVEDASASNESAAPPQSRAPATSDLADDEWVLVDGTPASCAQVGLHHLFTHRGPVDLVVSGPNFGRNSSALYALSSGTLGGALEAAACRVKAIGLSFAYDRPHTNDPEIVATSCRHSVRVIQHLWDNWGADVDLYSINVPVRPDVENQKVVVTFMLQNRWDKGQSCFKPVDAPGQAGADVVEETDKVLEDKVAREDTESATASTKDDGYRHRYYEWAPSHASVRRSAEISSEGSDAKALVHGWTSVTPLKAALWEVAAHPIGELKLTPAVSQTHPDASALTSPKLLAHIAYEDAYVQPLILSGLAAHLLPSEYTLVSAPLPPTTAIGALPCPFLHVAAYEALSHESLLLHRHTYFANSYTIRKALIRKHYLASIVASWRAKHADDPLSTHLPMTLSFELDYAEFLDEALIEAYELHEAWARNETRSLADREWWILKPGMSDRGQGIRLFSSEDDLRAIFEEWEAANPEDEDGDEEEGSEGLTGDEASTRDDDNQNDSHNDTQGLMASQLRHFVVQPYISPLLLPGYTAFHATKFHLRTYVLALGALRVFVHQQPLALFASKVYLAPGSTEHEHEYGSRGATSTDALPSAVAEGISSSVTSHTPRINMDCHLTNTCLQASSSSPSPSQTHNGPVALFTSLPLPPAQRTAILTTIKTCTASLFRAAVAQPAHFQPLPNAFEIYGVDWLVDEKGKPYLLEVNAFPDFGQSGEGEGHTVVEDVWRGTMGLVVEEVKKRRSGTDEKSEVKNETDGGNGHKGEEGGDGGKDVGLWGFVEVLNVDLRRG